MISAAAMNFAFREIPKMGWNGTKAQYLGEIQE